MKEGSEKFLTLSKKVSKAIKELTGKIERMRSERKKESQARDGLIYPIIEALGWKGQYEVEVDYSCDGISTPRAESSIVDYVLFGREGDPKTRPVVFIEAKRPGKVAGKFDDEKRYQKQITDYGDNHGVSRGVDLLILTDGDIWRFYLAVGRDKYPKSKPYFYQVVLSKLSENKGERDECAQYFVTYLQKDRVEKELAVRAAKARFKTQNGIPEVWRDMLVGTKKNARDLRSLLSDAVRNKYKDKPELADLGDFLQQQVRTQADFVSIASESKPADKPKGKVSSAGYTKIIGYIFDEERYDHLSSGRRTFEAILKHLGGRDPKFMQQFYDKLMGIPRRYVIAPNREDLLYEGKGEKDIVDLENGWWFHQKNNTKEVIEYIEIACEVANIRYGSDDGLMLIIDNEE